MDASFVGALSATLGAFVGGATTYATAWVTQRQQSRREILLAQIERRQELYGQFIVECSKLVIDAMDHSLEKPEKLFEVYALQNKIRLTSSEQVISAGEDAIKNILRQYFSPNFELNEFHHIALTENEAADFPPDPLRAFSEACRHELALLHNGA